MGSSGKAFGDCAKVIMGWLKGVVVICVRVWSAYRKSQKEGRGGIKVDQGETSAGKQREMWAKVVDCM